MNVKIANEGYTTKFHKHGNSKTQQQNSGTFQASQCFALLNISNIWNVQDG